jgi:ParB/RepB/Spo0J family partition protein
MVPLARIAVGYNPRRYFDRKKHDELVASLRLRGMLQPMLVRPAADLPEHFTIVAGGRRFRAAMEAFGEDGRCRS